MDKFEPFDNDPLPQLELNPNYDLEKLRSDLNGQQIWEFVHSVIESPGKFNPFWFYGGKDSLKADLVQATGNDFLKLQPLQKILYLNIQDLLNFISNKTLIEAKSHFQNVGLLLLEDAQYLQGEPNLQKKLLAIFIHLLESNCQIVFSSDRPPAAMPALSEELRVFVQTGLVASYSLPDCKTRLAILGEKAVGKSIPAEVLEFMAHKIPATGYELEAALDRVIAYSVTYELPITVDLVAKVLDRKF